MSNIRNENEVQLSGSDDEEVIEDEPLGIIQINNDVNDDFDTFYNTRRESFGGTSVVVTADDEELDKSFEYIAGLPPPTSSILSEPEVTGLANFEFSIKHQPFNGEDYCTIDNSDFSRLLYKSPAEKFPNSLKLKHFGIKKMFADDFRKFKNNLSAIISDGVNDFLVLALNSELVFFTFDQVSSLPSTQLLRLDTSPPFTSSTDRLISTWPYFPHTINFVKAGPFNGKQILAACTDDGTLLIWYNETLMSLVSQFQKLNKQDNDSTIASASATNTSATVIKPDFRIKMEASLWGLDFKTCNGHSIIAASDNSQSIVLLYYHPVDQRFYHVKSHQILHNIPEVSIVSYKEEGQEHIVQVSCVSISGEIIVFEFKFSVQEGPLDEADYEHFKNELYYYVDSTMEQLENRNGIEPNELSAIKLRKFNRVNFTEPLCTSRVVLSEDCWTIKPLDLGWFLPVGSVQDVFGDSKIDETKELERIANESRILGKPSGMFQYFQSKTVSFEQPGDELYRSSKLTNVDDEYRRIHKELVSGSTSEILLVSTAKKLAMFRFPSLFCNCSTPKVFDLPIPFNDESKFTNRMSITKVIPELLCFIAVTQQGLVTIMRLCTYKGIYGMRQEHVFPNAMSLSLGYHGYRTIIGLSVRNRTIDVPCHNLYISYNDGLVIGYKLSL
ncbi:hypothetical protein Cantr_04649 [Candida viswanathii]|uniref:Uncharacterized protein n=1 Tax=Candida viswanathii TaxID=5486 RepID=A0A367XM55_9ASCO|nr:hypothetical protein Cantr_04649 [Candida viswanathii]